MDLSKLTLEDIKSMDSQPDSGYTVAIGTHVYERLEKHVLILKKLIDRSTTKQRWILDAIKQKLSKIDKTVPIERRIAIRIERSIDSELVKRVEYIRQFRTSYSKKQWILDAIIEKLEIDEEIVAKRVSETQK
jgi:Uri superfamily endonuclease